MGDTTLYYTAREGEHSAVGSPDDGVRRQALLSYHRRDYARHRGAARPIRTDGQPAASTCRRGQSAPWRSQRRRRCPYHLRLLGRRRPPYLRWLQPSLWA